MGLMKLRAVANQFLVSIIFFFNSSLAFSEDFITRGAVPDIFSAILNENAELYSKEMKRLLEGPFKEFNKTLLFRTDKGDTLFHFMAGVRSHQEFFVKEMQSLNDIFTQTSIGKTNLTIGGIKISIPYMEDTELGRAIQNRDAAVFLKIVNHLQETESTIEWLKHFHSTTKAGRHLNKFILEHFDMSPLSHLWSQSLEAIERHPDISLFLLTKNHKGLSPKDTAYASDNFFAYDFISSRIENASHFSKDKFWKASFGAGAVLGAGLSLGWGSVPYSLDPIGKLIVFKALETAAYGYLGGAALSASAMKCQDVFRKMKKNKLRKRSESQPKQL